MNIKTSWDLSHLLKSEDENEINAFLEASKKAAFAFADKWTKDKSYLEDPQKLLEALVELEEYESTYDGTGKIGYYFSMRQQLDQENPALKARNTKLEDFHNLISNRLEFFFLEVAKIAPEKQNKFLNYPGLTKYKHKVERVFAAARYHMTEAEEQLLNLTDTTSYDRWVQMTSEFIDKSEEKVLWHDKSLKKVPFNEIFGLLKSSDKDVRDSAAKAINKTLKNNVEVAVAEVNSILQYKKVVDELRGYERPDSARHLSDDIQTTAVDALIEAVSDRFDISQRLYKFKAKVLGLEKLKYHERIAPVSKMKKTYSFEEAVALNSIVFASLDPEFEDIFTNMLADGLFDVYPKKGKSGGAFCARGTLKDPSYILLNYSNNFGDVQTIAHEMGHALNNEYMARNQNSHNFGSPVCTAEVASTFFEDFVTEKAYEGLSDEEKFSFLVDRLDGRVASIFRQVACYRFEQDLHAQFREKGHLSVEDMGELFAKNMSAYMGPYVEQSKGSENWWVYWSHIRNFFYVYSYASGELISMALQERVREDKSFVQEFKKFLGAGRSKSPVEIFADMGIDITSRDFWLSGIKKIESELDEAEKLFAKIGPQI